MICSSVADDVVLVLLLFILLCLSLSDTLPGGLHGAVVSVRGDP